MLVVFVRLFMGFLHFLPHLLVHHHPWAHHARTQRDHRRHARGRRGAWRRIGAYGLVSWAWWLGHRIAGPSWRESWIPWGRGAGPRRKGWIDRWWMRWTHRIGTSRVPRIGWVWPLMPGIGIPHVQVFPPIQKTRKLRDPQTRSPFYLRSNSICPSLRSQLSLPGHLHLILLPPRLCYRLLGHSA